MDPRQAQRGPTQSHAERAPRLLVGRHETVVFVDRSGRRARGVRIIGAAMVAACALWLAGLVMGVAGFSRFPVAKSPVGDLAALARVRIAHTTASREEAREDSTSRGWRQRDVDTPGDRSRAVCMSGDGAARVGALAGSTAYSAAQKGASNPACVSKLPVAQHRDSARLT